MGNDMKIDAINIAALTKSSLKDSKVSSAQPVNNDKKTVTNNLGSLVNQLLASNNAPQQSSRVVELKEQIAKNQYKIDIDKLATKLTHTILNTK